MNLSVKQKFIERCRQLIREGEKLKETRQFPPPNVIGGLSVVEQETFYKWKNKSENLIIMTSGKDSVYHRDFSKEVTTCYFNNLEIGIGILKGLEEDLKQGFLEKVQDLVVAEVFTDFLDQAEHLLENKYKDPAASLAGAVLENGLKKIAKKNDIPVQERDAIDSLNQKLSQKQIYNEFKKRSIHAWKEIRNNAAHGEFDKYTENDVKAMIDGISNFLSENF